MLAALVGRGARRLRARRGEAIGNAVGVGTTLVTVWDIAKWPVMLLVIMLYARGALLGVAERRSPPDSAGCRRAAIVAVVLWIVASAAFAFYAANFGSYDRPTARWAA